jgi:phosphate uptake regulator
MSLVKDAERMGDYAKNILDLAEELDGTQKDFKYLDKLTSIKIKIAGNLPKLKTAYVGSNGGLAQQILSMYAPIKAECKELLGSILKEDLPSREAVATALMCKYLGRMGSHLGNVASGIIYPLDKIDFVQPDSEE